MSTKRKRNNPKRNLALRLYYTPGSETFGHITNTAERVNCNPTVLSRWINSEAGKEFQAEIEAEQRIASSITIEKIQSKLYQIAEKALEAKQFHAAISAYNALLKTLGGFVQDRLPAENLAGKMLDAEKARYIREALDLYYAKKYLADEAVKQIEDEISQEFSLTPPTGPH